jgi:hypothetical protein
MNQLLDRISDFLAKFPGLLPLAGVVLVVLNFILQVAAGGGTWVVDSNLFLHLGLILSVVGLLIIKPLG